MRKKAPNFLLPWQYETFPFQSLFFLGLLTVFFVLLLQINTAAAVVLFAGGIVFFLSLHLEWALYILVAISFFHGWELNFSQYHSLRRIPYLAGINAPAVDFFAIILFFAVLTAIAFRFAPINWRALPRLFPGWLWYGLFLVVALLSLRTIFNNEFGTGIKYIVRPMAFVFIMFVGLSCFVIQRKQVLDRVLKIWFWVGLGIAAFGVVAFIRSIGFGGWPRVVPFAIRGFAPLGYNHNLVAEVLVALVPIGAYLAIQAKEEARAGYAAGTVAMLGVALLTLSRAAWVSFGLCGLVVVYWYRKDLVAWLKKHVEALYILGAGALVVLGYMFFFLGSSVVTSSNEARIVSTDVALFYAARAPVLGNGPGTFMSILGSAELFTEDFGDPLDAHGFVQKIILEEGVLGLLFFGLFLGYVLQRLWKYQAAREKDYLLFQIFFISVLGAIVFQLFNTSYFNANMWMPIGIALAGLQLYVFGENYAFKK